MWSLADGRRLMLLLSPLLLLLQLQLIGCWAAQPPQKWSVKFQKDAKSKMGAPPVLLPGFDDATDYSFSTLYVPDQQLTVHREDVTKTCYVVRGLRHERPSMLYPISGYIHSVQMRKLAGSMVADFCVGYRKVIAVAKAMSSRASPVDRKRRNAGNGYAYQPRGRYRGQTQSQYLNFGAGNSTLGKAEAESTREGSRAVVSGTNGMGQAQSQSFGSNCEDCYDSQRSQNQALSLNGRGYGGTGTYNPYGNVASDLYPGTAGKADIPGSLSQSKRPGGNGYGVSPSVYQYTDNKRPSDKTDIYSGYPGGTHSPDGKISQTGGQVYPPGKMGGGSSDTMGSPILTETHFGAHPGQTSSYYPVDGKTGQYYPTGQENIPGPGQLSHPSSGSQTGQTWQSPQSEYGLTPGQKSTYPPIIQPGQGQFLPGQGQLQTGQGTLQGGNGRIQPGQGQLQPGFGQPQPGYGQLQPGQGQLQPGQGKFQPGQGQLQPGQGQLQPGQGQLQPGQGQLQPGQGQLQHGQGHLQPGQGQLQPGQGQLQSNQGQLPSGFGQLQPGQSHYQPGQGQLQPGQGRLQPGQGQLQPGQGQLQNGQGYLQTGQGQLPTGQNLLRPGQGQLQPGYGLQQTGYTQGQNQIHSGQGEFQPGQNQLQTGQGRQQFGQSGYGNGHTQPGQGKFHTGTDQTQTVPEQMHTGKNQLQYGQGQGQLQPGYSQTQIEQGQLQPGHGRLQPGQGQSQFGQGTLQGGQGRIQPGQGQLQPGFGQSQPGYGQLQPGQGQLQPGQGKFQPGQGQLQTGQGQIQPGQGQLQPGQGQLQSGQGQLQPGHGQIQHGQVGLQSGQGQLQPGFGQSQPGYGDLQPGQGQIQPGQGQIQPGQGHTQFGQGRLQHGQEQLQPGQGQGQPQPGYGQPLPGYGQGQLQTGQGRLQPGQGQLQPGQLLTGQGQLQPGQLQPGQGQLQPGFGQLQPSYEQFQPGQTRLQPGQGQLQPGQGQLQPGQGQLQPGQGQLQPGQGQLQPGQGQLQPGQGQLQPGQGQLQPGQGQLQPGQGQFQPGYGQLQPGQGQGQLQPIGGSQGHYPGSGQLQPGVGQGQFYPSHGHSQPGQDQTHTSQDKTQLIPGQLQYGQQQPGGTQTYPSGQYPTTIDQSSYNPPSTYTNGQTYPGKQQVYINGQRGPTITGDGRYPGSQLESAGVGTGTTGPSHPQWTGREDYDGYPQTHVLQQGGVATDGGAAGEGPGSFGEDSSQAETSVNHIQNETQASASSMGTHEDGVSQTQISGIYSGSGSFSAQAQSSDRKRGAQSQISVGKLGAMTSAQGSSGLGKSQAQFVLGSDTGSTKAAAQSIGWNHGTNTLVQTSEKGGMADAQANGPGSTSSQAQIGFQPYQENNKDDNNESGPFRGGGTASSQSGKYAGQSQTQIHGKFKYSISYNGAAQAESGSRDSFSNKTSFKPLDVFNKNPQRLDREVNQFVPSDEADDKIDTMKISNKKSMSETESKRSTFMLTEQTPELNFTNLGITPHQSPIKSDNEESEDKSLKFSNPEEYEDTDEDDEYDGDFTSSTDIANQKVQYPYNPKEVVVQQAGKRQKQHIILGPLGNNGAHVVQDSASNELKEGMLFQPGEVIPGTQGYTIPIGFRGRVTSVSGNETYSYADDHGESQAQTVTLTPGSRNITYSEKPVKTQSLRSWSPGKRFHGVTMPLNKYNLRNSPENYVTVTKSITGTINADKDNPAEDKQFSHTYYTKSSTCGYFTFSCNTVYGSNGRTKICRPKAPTNPDGSPVQC